MNRCRPTLTLLAAAAALGLTGCAGFARSPYCPDRFTAGFGGSYDMDRSKFDRLQPQVSFSWRLRPVPVLPARKPASKNQSEEEAP